MPDLRVVGAGLGRTGTHSLKLALERLLGAPCYHMVDVFQRREHIPIWHVAAKREPVDWRKLLDGYAAVVDWPAAAFWADIAEAFPEALILFSVRSADSWWKSASRTIFVKLGQAPDGSEPPGWRSMIADVFGNTFTPDFLQEGPAKAAFDRHTADVRNRAPGNRLLEWRAEDGWGPICRALGLPVPDEPFPLTNTTEQFRTRLKLDP